MRFLITLILCLLTLPAMAQVDTVTHSNVEFTLPVGNQFDYSRDMLAHLDDQWALDNVQLAFLISEQEGQTVEIPTFMAPDVRETVDSLYTVMAQAVIELDQKDQTISDQSSQINNLQTQLQQAEDALEPVQALADSLQTENDYAVRRIREAMQLYLNR